MCRTLGLEFSHPDMLYMFVTHGSIPRTLQNVSNSCIVPSKSYHSLSYSNLVWHLSSIMIMIFIVRMKLAVFSYLWWSFLLSLEWSAYSALLAFALWNVVLRKGSQVNACVHVSFHGHQDIKILDLKHGFLFHFRKTVVWSRKFCVWLAN